MVAMFGLIIPEPLAMPVMVMGCPARVSWTLAPLGRESAARGIGLLIQFVTGRETPPRRDNLQSLTDRLLSQRAFPGATLGGAMVTRKGAIVHLAREEGLDRPDSLLNARLSAMRSLFLGQP